MLRTLNPESRVRFLGEARCRGGCWWPIWTFNPGRAGSIPVHGAPSSPSPTGRGAGLRNRRIGVRSPSHSPRAARAGRCPHPGRVLTGCRPAARPPALGAGDRGFESLHPDLPVDQWSGHLADIEEMPVRFWPGRPMRIGPVARTSGSDPEDRGSSPRSVAQCGCRETPWVS